MNRNLLLFGAVAAFGLAAAVAGAGDATRSAAADESVTAASVSSCCAKGETAAAKSASASCMKGATATTASVNNGCTRSASAVTADMTMAAGCDKNAAAGATAAGGSCEKGTAVAAGGDACCKSGAAAKTASSDACKAVCDEAKTAQAFKAAIDELPYRENKRVVLTGAYVCGSCNLHVTDGCSPLFKTTDGKVYPLIKNNESGKLRAANSGKGIEIASTVKKLDGIKYLEVKSYKAL